MRKAIKFLIPATIVFIPSYLVKFSVFGIPTNVLEILILACFGWLVFSRTDRTDRINRIYVLAITLIFIGLLVSTLINENWRTSFGIIKGWFAAPLIFGWVLVKGRKGKGEEEREGREEEKEQAERVKSVLHWLYLSVFLVAATSFVYYFISDLTYDGRLKAFYLSPNHLAMYLAPGLIIGIYLIRNATLRLTGKNIQGWRLLAYAGKRHSSLFFYVISLLIILLSLYFTYSYAAWLAIILSLAVVYLIKNKKINKRTVSVSLIILLLIIASQWHTEKFNNLKNFSRSSLESRITIWQSAGKILKDNIILGIGPGNFQNKYLEYQKYFPPYLEWAVPQPHNLYLAFWLQAGIIGLAGFLVMLVFWLKSQLEIIRKQKNGADIAAVPLGIMIYILFHGLADTTYWKNDLATVFWIIFTLGIIISRESANKNSLSL